jgi:glycosyltransferase involved in cell wall biosynthesis
MPDSPLKFGIIMPTYNRPELLLGAVESLLANDYQDWVLAVVNDGSHVDYSDAVARIEDPRVRYIELSENRGCNHARNVALEALLAEGCDFITNLDDDERFTPDAFTRAREVIEAKPGYHWYLCNADYGGDNAVTEEGELDYVDDYLYGHTLSGEKTHFISSGILGKIRFWEIVRSGEEWTYYLQVGAKTKIWGYPHDASYGEYLEGGLTTQGIYKKFTPIIYFMEQAKPTLALLQKPRNKRAWADFWIQTRQIPTRLLKILLFYMRVYDPNKGIRRKKARVLENSGSP